MEKSWVERAPLKRFLNICASWHHDDRKNGTTHDSSDRLLSTMVYDDEWYPLILFFWLLKLVMLQQNTVCNVYLMLVTNFPEIHGILPQVGQILGRVERWILTTFTWNIQKNRTTHTLSGVFMRKSMSTSQRSRSLNGIPGRTPWKNCASS